MPRKSKKQKEEEEDPVEIAIQHLEDDRAIEEKKEKIKQQFFIRMGVQAHLFFLLQRFDTADEAKRFFQENLADYFKFIWGNMNSNIQQYNKAKMSGLNSSFSFLFDELQETEDIQSNAAKILKEARVEIENTIDIDTTFGESKEED